MTQPLRRGHFWIWIVLSITIGVVFIAGLMARHPNTPNNSSFHWEHVQ